MEIYEKCNAASYLFFFNDTTLPSRQLEKNVIMTSMDENIKDEKLQYDIKREAPKMSALSSVEIDIYEYCTDEKLD